MRTITIELTEEQVNKTMTILWQRMEVLKSLVDDHKNEDEPPELVINYLSNELVGIEDVFRTLGEYKNDR
jgi:hypothetical protein